MKKFILLLILPIISIAQGYGDCIEGNCENGHGTWHSHSTLMGYNGAELIETKYTGAFENGQFHGLGTMDFMYQEGDDVDDIALYTYEGSFLNGKVNGYCVTTKSSPYGDYWRFTGQYTNDKRNGIGIFYEGSYGAIQESGYVGYWVNGKFIKEIAKF